MTSTLKSKTCQSRMMNGGVRLLRERRRRRRKDVFIHLYHPCAQRNSSISSRILTFIRAHTLMFLFSSLLFASLQKNAERERKLLMWKGKKRSDGLIQTLFYTMINIEREMRTRRTLLNWTNEGENLFGLYA